MIAMTDVFVLRQVSRSWARLSYNRRFLRRYRNTDPDHGRLIAFVFSSYCMHNPCSYHLFHFIFRHT